MDKCFQQLLRHFFQKQTSIHKCSLEYSATCLFSFKFGTFPVATPKCNGPFSIFPYFSVLCLSFCLIKSVQMYRDRISHSESKDNVLSKKKDGSKISPIFVSRVGF